MGWDIVTLGDPPLVDTVRLSDAGLLGEWDDDQLDMGYTFSHAVAYDFRCAMASLTWDLVVEHVATCGDRARWPFRTIAFQPGPR